MRAARDHFLAVYRAVEKYLFTDETRVVVRAIERALAADGVPDFVVRYDYRVENDSTATRRYGCG